MTDGKSALYVLATELGISARFRDTLGNTHVASEPTVRALVRAAGFAADREREIADGLAALRADPFRDIPVARAGAVEIPLPVPAEWRILLEDGSIREGKAGGMLRVSGLPVGLHRLTIVLPGGGARTMPLPSPPAAAPSAAALTGKVRHWGVAAPLYGLPGALGVGTYPALGELAAGLAAAGAAYMLVNPVHALFPGAPDSYSPYSPSHRGFFNIAHVDPACAPEFGTAPEAQALCAHGEAEPGKDALVDYPGAAAALRPELEALFSAFEALASGHPRICAFEAWRQERAPTLERYTAYEALAERHGAFWPDWPATFRDACGSAADPAPGREARKHAYFQWLAETQLAEAQTAARAGGMALGLMLDLAVGVRADGAETWGEPDNFARGVSIGAPPDGFNPKGQNWALAPLNPLAMRDGGLFAFAETLRASMRHAGALRIDHILGLRRNFWVAEETGEGAYIRFPQTAMFAVLAIEAARNRCLVVGEDLGNVPAGFRDEMAASGVYGCRPLYFQRTAAGKFADPGGYEPATVASVGSHDLATLREWWAGTDLDEMAALGVLTGDALVSARARRESDRGDLCGLLGLGAEPDVETLVAGVHARLAESGSDLVTVQLEMLLEGGARLNLPGTTVEYPNWRRKLPPVAGILRDQRLQAILAKFRLARPA